MIKINGKDYMMVHERLAIFRKKYPDWTIETEIIKLDDTEAVLQAIIKDETGKYRAGGLAREVVGKSKINEKSHVENAETSAWGRALANLGIGIEGGIASAEEVENAVDPLLSMPEDLKAYYRQKNMLKKEVRKECKTFNYDWELIKAAIEAVERVESQQFSPPADPQEDQKFENLVSPEEVQNVQS